MGADLIGYMCVGPTLVTAEQKVAAKEKAWRVFLGMRAWWLAAEENPSPEPPPEIIDVLDCCQIDEPHELEALRFGGDQDIETAGRQDVDGLVDEIVAFWNCPATRDSVCRDLSDDERVVFCGEASWGDEPDGSGYLLIKMAHILDILWELGIH